MWHFCKNYIALCKKKFYEKFHSLGAIQCPYYIYALSMAYA